MGNLPTRVHSSRFTSPPELAVKSNLSPKMAIELTISIWFAPWFKSSP